MLRAGVEFQFPSNGKVYPKLWLMARLGFGSFVSIPFKRESISKDYGTLSDNFLLPCFNSLQTGKYIQSYRDEVILDIFNVSIPFKRESISKAEGSIAFSSLKPRFQFPSNGKVYPKLIVNYTKNMLLKVSIPFKRESISKGDASLWLTGGEWYVSIPFKRESISKAKKGKEMTEQSVKFQFPSNGKVYPKFHQLAFGTFALLFQFPSNGKVYPKFS